MGLIDFLLKRSSEITVLVAGATALGVGIRKVMRMIHRLKVSADEAWANHVGAQVKDYIGEALTPINKRLDQTDLWRLHHDERHDRLETLMTTLGSKTEALHDDLRAHMAEEERNKREPS